MRHVCRSPQCMGRADEPSRGADKSVLIWLALLEGGQLVVARLFLMLGLPLLVRHAVDDFARIVLTERLACLASRFLIPVRQAVAAEAGEIHQVYVLDVCALPHVLHELAK